MRKEALKGKGLAYEGRVKRADMQRVDELVLQYGWDAATEYQHEHNEEIKDKLKILGVTKISNSGTKSFGRVEVKIEKKDDDGFNGKNPAELW